MNSKKSKEKAKKIEDTTTSTSTTDSDVIVNSPSLINPTHINLISPRSPSESIGFPSLSIPVPQQSNSKCLYLINLLTYFLFIE